jgi:hypothetical protein
MNFVEAAQIYGIVSLALAGTSYVTLYRPAIYLTEEIVEENLAHYRGWLGTLAWFSIATPLSPLVAIILLKNNNNSFIEKFAIKLADRVEE